MTTALIGLLEAYFQSRAEAFTATDPEFDIYDEILKPGSKYDYVPHTLFFDYVSIADDDKLQVEHYFYPDPNGDPTAKPKKPTDWPQIPLDKTALTGIITKLANNARTTKSSPPPYAANFANLIWRRPGYIAILVDEKFWRLLRYTPVDGKERRAVIFYPTKDGKPRTKNHSFTDAMDFEITVKDSAGKDETRRAIVFVNHLKDKDGKTLTGNKDDERYEFGIFVEVDYTSTGGIPMTVIFDPGGTNQGPPIDP